MGSETLESPVICGFEGLKHVFSIEPVDGVVRLNPTEEVENETDLIKTVIERNQPELGTEDAAAGLTNPLTIVDFCRTYRVKSSINHTQYHFQLHMLVRDCGLIRSTLCLKLLISGAHLCLILVIAARPAGAQACSPLHVQSGNSGSTWKWRASQKISLFFCAAESSDHVTRRTVEHIFRRSLCDFQKEWNLSSECCWTQTFGSGGTHSCGRFMRRSPLNSTICVWPRSFLHLCSSEPPFSVKRY